MRTFAPTGFRFFYGKYKHFFGVFAAFAVVLASIGVSYLANRQPSTDTRSNAATTVNIIPSMAFSEPYSNPYDLKEFSGRGTAVTVQTTYKKLEFVFTLGSGTLLNNQSVLRVLYPVTGAGSSQYGWTMGQYGTDGQIKYNPVKEKISASTSRGVPVTIKTGDLNQGRISPIFYIDLQPNDFLNDGDQIKLTILDVITQALPVNNNAFQLFVDQLGNNNYVYLNSLVFTAFSKPANTAKVFIDSFFSPGSAVKVNVTPAYASDNDLKHYRYPSNDDLYDGTISLRLGNGSGTHVRWPDGRTSAEEP